jgi:hypothetical protein
MASTNISKTNGSAIAGLNGIVDQLDAGGNLVIYDGTVPADADASIGASTALATFSLNTPAFGPSVQDGNDARSDLDATGLSVAADASGQATYWRATNGAGTVTYMQGECDGPTNTGSLNFDDPVFSQGGTVTITSLIVRLAE